tara:strand:- start:2491 stop:3162 length:672 start_codon:yes stop_codon:yes gene_type:complete
MASTAYGEDNLYEAISQRNAFDLTTETIKPILPPVAEILRPIVFLTGITRHQHMHQAHLVLKEVSPLASAFLSLSPGQQKDNVKVIEIKKNSVVISNNGSKELLTFKGNGLPTVRLSSPSKKHSSSKKDDKRSRSSSQEPKSKTTTPPTLRPQIVRVPSRKPQIDPRIIEKGLEYLSKTDNDEKREYLLKRLESLQSGQSRIKSDIDQNERRRQYDEWKKRNN